MTLALAAKVAITPLFAAALLAVSAPAHASTTSPLQRRAKRHHLHGAWHAEDPEHDGIANLREYTLNTLPRRAGSDRDGLRDGDEPRIASSRELADRHGERIVTAINFGPRR